LLVGLRCFIRQSGGKTAAVQKQFKDLHCAKQGRSVLRPCVMEVTYTNV